MRGRSSYWRWSRPCLNPSAWIAIMSLWSPSCIGSWLRLGSLPSVLFTQSHLFLFVIAIILILLSDSWHHTDISKLASLYFYSSMVAWINILRSLVGIGSGLSLNHNSSFLIFLTALASGPLYLGCPSPVFQWIPWHSPLTETSWVQTHMSSRIAVFEISPCQSGHHTISKMDSWIWASYQMTYLS